MRREEKREMNDLVSISNFSLIIRRDEKKKGEIAFLFSSSNKLFHFVNKREFLRNNALLRCWMARRKLSFDYSSHRCLRKSTTCQQRERENRCLSVSYCMIMMMMIFCLALPRLALPCLRSFPPNYYHLHSFHIISYSSSSEQ